MDLVHIVKFSIEVKSYEWYYTKANEHMFDKEKLKMRVMNEKVYSGQDIFDSANIFRIILDKNLIVTIDETEVRVLHVRYIEEDYSYTIKVYTPDGVIDLQTSCSDSVAVITSDDHCMIKISIRDLTGKNKHIIKLKHS